MFIQVNYNTIINTDTIHKIERISINNELYTDWWNSYNTLLLDVVKEYMSKNPTGEYSTEELLDIEENYYANELYERFGPIVKKNIESEYGICPEPFEFEYKIISTNGFETLIDKDTYNELCNVLNIELKDFDIDYIND